MLSYIGKTYRLSFVEDRPYVYVDSGDGKRLMDLFVLSAVNTSEGKEDHLQIGQWEKIQEDHLAIFRLSVVSSVWQDKEVQFICDECRFVYQVTISGEGSLDEIHYFGGYYSGHLRWGSGFFYSGQNFLQGFNPEPDSAENYYFSAGGGSQINLTGVPLPGKADWFFTPPPFCFAFSNGNDWVGLGVEAQPGENHYTSFTYHGMDDAFHLSLSFEGHKPINGKVELPKIGFDFRNDPYQVLKAHVQALPGLQKKQNDIPSWWKEPIFCGWGAQCHRASLEKGHAPNYSRQSLYIEFLKALDDHQVNPGIVVLDDKWQLTYGENQADPQKWPDLEGFVRSQHQIGRKVLLWLKAWDPEGLPAEECIVNAAGLPIAFDPSNPKFETHLRESVRLMISNNGYDADGFKIDFTARIPSGPGLQSYGQVWGLELMKLYLSILKDEAKTHKKDALIMSHTPHPYLADVIDMIRLNDINTGHPVNPAMQHRAKISAIACPDLIIDTDNWPMKDKATWRDYVNIQADLGVPSLYFATHIDSTGEALEDEDYALIRSCWQRWKEKTQLRNQ